MLPENGLNATIVRTGFTYGAIADFIILLTEIEYDLSCCVYAGISMEVKVEADSNDITKHSQCRCPECGECFEDSRALTIHKRSHAGERMFEYTACGKLFRTSRKLAHGRIHIGEKPYKCQFCDKAFSQSRRLQSHIKLHTGENHTSVQSVRRVSADPAPCKTMNVMFIVTKGHTSVHFVERSLRLSMNWSLTFVFILMQSRTLVYTVQSVLEGLANSRNICWSCTMKAPGSSVTFVRRSSAKVVTLRHIYFDMKAWSHMFAVIVQRAFVQQLNLDLIVSHTLTLNSFAVVYVVNILSIKITLSVIIRDVLTCWDVAVVRSIWISCKWKVDQTKPHWQLIVID